MRDHTRLKVFALADRLALAIYRESAQLPTFERFGLCSQMHRAAVSIASNIVEGCARSSQPEYVRFLEIAYGSARELQYQVGLCGRLGFFATSVEHALNEECTSTAKALNGLLRSLRER